MSKYLVSLVAVALFAAGCSCEGAKSADGDGRLSDVGIADAGNNDGARSDVGVRDAVIVVDSNFPDGCVAATEICNGVDDNCDGIVDDVDLGNDGFCDCLRIGILGGPGPRPGGNFQAWIEARGSTVERITDADTVITDEILSRFDVLVIDRLYRSCTPSETARIAAWVEAGHGLMSMTGYANDTSILTEPNLVLAELELSYSEPINANVLVASFVPGHPITEDLTTITFAGGWRVNSDVSSDVVVGTHSVIGNVGIAGSRGQGRVFVWGDEWITYDSEWTTMADIPKFWSQVFNWLGPQQTCRIVIL